MSYSDLALAYTWLVFINLLLRSRSFFTYSGLGLAYLGSSSSSSSSSSFSDFTGVTIIVPNKFLA